MSSPRDRPKALLKRLLYRIMPPRLYMYMYARDTDRRVQRDPDRASGEPGAIIGPKVLAYVRGAGLEPHHRLLDFGCGTLRTGRYLMEYLDPGRYVGVDISGDVIRHSREWIAGHGAVAEKDPRVWHVAPYEPLELPWTPDYILCHSVFTHLPRTPARKTFRQLREVMSAETTLVFSAFIGPSYRYHHHKDIVYPASEMLRLATSAGIAVAPLEGDWGLRQRVFIGRAR